MDENISQQPQEPIQPNIPQDLPKKPKSNGDWKGRRGALEGLPIELKEDMEAYMRAVNPNASKKYMAEKYGDKYPVLKELSNIAFSQYFKRHNIKVSKELALQKKSAEITPEIKDVIDKITDPSISLEDKRKALTALFNSCEERSKMLQQRQTNFIDPSLEALILGNRKEQHAILKTVATLSDQLSKDADKDWLQEASSLTQVILSSVYNTYKLTNGDTNFSQFRASLDENLTNILKQYTLSKERAKSVKKESN